MPSGQDAARPADDVQSFVARALTDVSGTDYCAIVTLSVPFAPLSTFLLAVPRHMSVMWDSPDGVAYAASGVVRHVELREGESLATLRAWSDTLWKRVVYYNHPRVPKDAPPPRIFGGLAFARGACRGTPWEEFSDASFTLPRWTYGRSADSAFLRLATRGDEDTGPMWRHKLLEELDSILEALDAYEGQSTSMRSFPVRRTIPVSCVKQTPFELWAEHVERIRTAIAGRQFQKIVAARRCDVELRTVPDEIDVVSRLIAEPQCTRFAFRRSHSTFLGASPEVLFLKHGVDLHTQALAGTIQSIGSEAPMLSAQMNRLLASSKDVAEHAVVVREIEDSLRLLCEEIKHPARPELRKIRSILHLNTPFNARLLPGVHVTDLLAALHPTPAVAGLPVQDATQWILANEPFARGWYTGAVGWLDAVGDGSFVVAIRSGVLTQDRAYVFTGAGIMDKSDAEAEYSETKLKQRPLLEALGVEIK
jgi:menaquinone-specific isochorismate synthase